MKMLRKRGAERIFLCALWRNKLLYEGALFELGIWFNARNETTYTLGVCGLISKVLFALVLNRRISGVRSTVAIQEFMGPNRRTNEEFAGFLEGENAVRRESIRGRPCDTAAFYE